MADSFGTFAAGLQAPAENGESITPDDDNDLADVTRALYVGGTGDVKVTLVGGDTVTFVSMVAGTVYPLRVERVHSTSTTATNLIGLH